MTRNIVTGLLTAARAVGRAGPAGFDVDPWQELGAEFEEFIEDEGL